MKNTDVPDKVEIRSTSRNSATCSDILLRVTGSTRLVFRPVLVNNPIDQQASVNGQFLFQKKGFKDEWCDTARIPLSKLKKGDKGYIHAYVRGADNVPYAVVISGNIIDMVCILMLDVCENFTTNKEPEQQQSTDKAFALCGVSGSDFSNWDDVFGILAWAFKQTPSGEMSLDSEAAYKQLNKIFEIKRR